MIAAVNAAPISTDSGKSVPFPTVTSVKPRLIVNSSPPANVASAEKLTSIAGPVPASR